MLANHQRSYIYQLKLATLTILTNISWKFGLKNVSSLQYFKNCAETSDMLEMILANVAQLWDPHRWIQHPKLPLLRPQKHQNPSNGSKVIPILRIFPIWTIFLICLQILQIGTTFEPFDGFWCFWGLSRGNLGCRIHLGGSQSCAKFASNTSSILLVSAHFLKNPSPDISKWKSEAIFFLRRSNVTCFTL